jgi:hypothetical protein
MGSGRISFCELYRGWRPEGFSRASIRYTCGMRPAAEIGRIYE